MVLGVAQTLIIRLIHPLRRQKIWSLIHLWVYLIKSLLVLYLGLLLDQTNVTLDHLWLSILMIIFAITAILDSTHNKGLSWILMSHIPLRDRNRIYSPAIRQFILSRGRFSRIWRTSNRCFWSDRSRLWALRRYDQAATLCHILHLLWNGDLHFINLVQRRLWFLPTLEIPSMNVVITMQLWWLGNKLRILILDRRLNLLRHIPHFDCFKCRLLLLLSFLVLWGNNGRGLHTHIMGLWYTNGFELVLGGSSGCGLTAILDVVVLDLTFVGVW